MLEYGIYLLGLRMLNVEDAESPVSVCIAMVAIWNINQWPFAIGVWQNYLKHKGVIYEFSIPHRIGCN